MAFHTITFQKSEEVAEDTKMFWFTKPEGFVFLPGQYVAMRLGKLVAPDAKNGVRSLSLASAPYEEKLGFAVRKSESGFKETLWSLEPGAKIEVTNAVGFFTVPEEETREVVFLIGGIGITPVRSILKEANHTGSTKAYTLFFANRGRKDAPFFNELQNLTLLHFRLIEVSSQCAGSDNCEHCSEHGYITKEMLTKYVPQPKEAVYYLVGSPAFVTAMETLLTDIGLTKDSWHVDPFTGLESKGK
jgi:ferredoxin-NADP reductase